MQATYRRPGWRNESYRHYLAAKGIKTGQALPAIPLASRQYLAARFAPLKYAKDYGDRQLAYQLPPEEFNKYSVIQDYQVGPSPGDEKVDSLLDSIAREQLRGEIERAKLPVTIEVREGDNLQSYPPAVEMRAAEEVARRAEGAKEPTFGQAFGEQLGEDFERLKDWTRPKWDAAKEWTAKEAQEAKKVAAAGVSKVGDWSDSFGTWSREKWEGSAPQKFILDEREQLAKALKERSERKEFERQIGREMEAERLKERKAKQAIEDNVWREQMRLKRDQQRLAFEKARQQALGKVVNPEAGQVLRMSDAQLRAGELNQRRFPTQEDYATMRRKLSELRYVPENRVQEKAMQVAAQQILEGKV